MAVIIEDMKIPEGCENCELSYFKETVYDDVGHVYCSYTGDCVDGFFKERANNCPLKEAIFLREHLYWTKNKGKGDEDE